jgi:hypothetical protein
MAMDVDKVVILHVSPEELQRFAASDVKAPEGWQAFVGDGGSTFYGQAIDDAVLLRSTTNFDTAEQLAQHFRALLGPTLDRHVDARGILVITTAQVSLGRSYDAFATSGEGTWIAAKPAENDSAGQGFGWSFADAARTFSTPGARQRIDARTKETAPSTPAAEGDPLELAEGKFGQIFAAQNERGALRRSLSAALDHSLDSSLLGDIVGSDQKPEGEESSGPLAGVIRRGISSDPNAMNALEATLKSVIDGGLKDDSETPAAEAAEPKA